MTSGSIHGEGWELGFEPGQTGSESVVTMLSRGCRTGRTEFGVERACRDVRNWHIAKSNGELQRGTQKMLAGIAQTEAFYVLPWCGYLFRLLRPGGV